MDGLVDDDLLLEVLLLLLLLKKLDSPRGQLLVCELEHFHGLDISHEDLLAQLLVFRIPEGREELTVLGEIWLGNIFKLDEHAALYLSCNLEAKLEQLLYVGCLPLFLPPDDLKQPLSVMFPLKCLKRPLQQ